MWPDELERSGIIPKQLATFLLPLTTHTWLLDAGYTSHECEDVTRPAPVNMSASNEPRPQLEEARDPFSSYQPVDAATALFTLNRAGGTDAANLHSPMPEQSGRNADAVNKLALPGIGLPIKQDSELPIEGRRGDWRHCATPVTVRERVMIAIMAALKDKPDWERKVFDELTVDKWRQEALTASDAVQAQEGTSDTPTAVDEQTQPDEVRDATSHYNAPARQRVVTERLFQYVSMRNTHKSHPG